MQTSPAFLRRTVIFAIFVIAASFCKAPAVAQNTPAKDIDRSTKPGDDFYQCANGGWFKNVAIPAGQTSYDTRSEDVV